MHPHLPDHISLAAFLIWEQQQSERYEWDDGSIVLCRGGSDDHAAIITNVTTLLANALPEDGPCFVRVGSERRLVPRDAFGNDLGSGYCDVFVSCAPEDRIGPDVHYPSIVVEVLSPADTKAFTTKKRAYLASRDIKEYLIVESTQRSIEHYYWTADRRLALFEYTQGPVVFRSLDLRVSFEKIYRGTTVTSILRPVQADVE